MNTNSSNRYLTAALMIGSIIGTYFLSRPRKSILSTQLEREQQDELDTNLLTPANETFGVVWPVVYAGATGLAIHQALPSQRTNVRYEQAGPWFRISYALNALFGFFFAKGDRPSRTGASLTTIAMLPTALKIHQALRIGQETVSEPENTLRKSVSLYAGWLTAASVISVGNLLLQAGYRVSPKTATRLMYGVLSGTAGLGMYVSKRLNDPYYLFTLIAACVGIAAKQTGKNDSVARLAGAWALVLTGVAIQRIREQQRSLETADVAFEEEQPQVVQEVASSEAVAAE